MSVNVSKIIHLLKGCQCCRLLEHHAALVGDQLLGRESRNIDCVVSWPWTDLERVADGENAQAAEGVEYEDDEDEERDEAEDDFLFGTLLAVGKNN